MEESLSQLIRRWQLTADKHLGQHFLTDPSLLRSLVATAGDLNGRSVIEIGGGPGGLTRALLQSPARDITVIEVDRRAVALLSELAETAPEALDGRLKIVAGDALKFDLRTLAADLAPQRQIIANLPYNIGTLLLIKWLKQAAFFEQMLLMFQTEVAERLVAVPGTGAYGRLSLLTQYVCSAEIVRHIPPGAFSPPPKVSSSMVRLVPHAKQPLPENLHLMEEVTKAAFGQRRKMLRSALKPLGGALLAEKAGINPERRAETLSLAEFEKLCQALTEFRVSEKIK